MKIIAIIGSMRKKNTYGIIKILEERITAKEASSFDYIFLEDYNINYCKCCGICAKDGIEKCPHKDDYLIIRNKISSADVIILSTPVYACNVSGILKNFIDRSFQMIFTPFLFDKKAIIIASSTDNGLKFVINYLKFIVKLWGMNLIGEIGVPMKIFRNSEKYKIQLLKKIDVIINKIFSEKKNIKLYDLMIFNSQKKNVINNKNYHVQSYEYWEKNNLLESNFFINIRLNPIKIFLTKFFKLHFTKN